MSTQPRDHRTVLQHIARDAMRAYGLEPDLPADAVRELARLGQPRLDGIRDLRDLLWSSIDNDESRDLDQLEVCADPAADAAPGCARLLVAIADVDSLVPDGSAIDDHARLNTTSVYTPAQIFPMLPEELSTDRTSLNEDADRSAIVVDLTIDEGGDVVAADVYRAAVRNRAKLTYQAVGAWLEGEGAMPAAMTAVPGLEAQVRQQDQCAQRLRARREQAGALDFDRSEVRPVLEGDTVRELRIVQTNRARDLIESVMVAANAATASFLASRGYPSIRRVVRAPERWPRIVELARASGDELPAEPDAAALERFLKARRAAIPADAFADLSTSVIKLLGRGIYVAEEPRTPGAHFALAVSNYTHATAPNRRFPDLVTQRMVKAAVAGRAGPYDLATLERLAEHCTRQEDAANKVERRVRKSAAALWLSSRIGATFDGVVTGASPKGTWVRAGTPPVEGRLEHGFEGLDVGDRVRVRLVHTDVERGFIDFARV
jgi:VacB/RNase II family 3'-5' exoribonuclease